MNNELYIGKYVWNRTEGRKNRKTGKISPNPEEWWVREN